MKVTISIPATSNLYATYSAVAGNIVKAGEAFTATELAAIEAILTNSVSTDAAYITLKGYDTKDNEVENEDVSADDMTYARFLRLYTEEGDDDTVTVSSFNSGMGNGDYIKAVDTDDDGYADYVLKTTYEIAVIDDISSRGVYTISDLNSDGDAVTIDSEYMASDDDLAEGDVIIYALIDGIYYTNVAETVTVTIDDIDYDDEALTTDADVEYEQSDITVTDTFEDDFVDGDVMIDIIDAEEGNDYVLYLDNYGYVRALVLDAATSGYALLTDAYYYTNGRTSGTVYQVEMYAGTADVADYTVNSRATSKNTLEAYINANTKDDTNDNGVWGLLHANDDGVVTNVAMYAGDTDSVTLYSTSGSVGIATTNTSNTVSTRILTDDNGDTVYTTTDTLYYYVVYRGTNATSVSSWIGYSNSSNADVSSKTSIADATVYAIVNDGVADVVVIETAAASSVVFVTNTDLYRDDTLTRVTAYEADEDEGDASKTTLSGMTAATADVGLLDFYFAGPDSLTAVTTASTYKAQYIFAGVVSAGQSVIRKDYIPMAYVNTGKYNYISSTGASIYTIAMSGTGVYSLSPSSYKNIDEGDILIYVTDSSYNVIYVINVSKSVNKNDVIYNDILETATKILDESNYTVTEINIYGSAETVIDTITLYEYNDVYYDGMGNSYTSATVGFENSDAWGAVLIDAADVPTYLVNPMNADLGGTRYQQVYGSGTDNDPYYVISTGSKYILTDSNETYSLALY